MQVGDEDAPRQQGVGLGLSIVRRLIRMMGGELAVDNTPGGTAMHIVLPFVAEPAPRPKQAPRTTKNSQAARPPARPTIPGQGDAAATHSVAAAGKGLVILVAEDDTVSLFFLRSMLQKMGHRVHAAGDGGKALRLLASKAVDVVFMDMQMPGMDGMSATRAIRAGEAGEINRRVPIIALTAHAMGGDRKRFLESGMDDYLAKPVSGTAIRKVLHRVRPDADPRP